MSTPLPLTNIALIGATGNLGPHILHALHTHSSPFNLTILTRSPTTTNNKPPLPFPPSIKILQSPDNDHYSSEFLHKALTGIDAVVLSLAAAALEGQKGIIDACVERGVRRVVVSEWGSDTTNPLAVEGVPFFKAKVEVVEYAKKAVAEQGPEGRLSWSAVVNGPFYDWCFKLGFFGIDVENKKVELYDEGKGEFTATTLTQIGRSVASLLAYPTKYANSYIFISSFTISQAAIFAAVRAATGTETTDWTVENKSVEARMQAGKEKAAKGDIHGTYDLIFGSMLGGSKYGSDYGNKREIANKELGLEKEDLESVTREVLEGKRPQVEW